MLMIMRIPLDKSYKMLQSDTPELDLAKLHLLTLAVSLRIVEIALHGQRDL